MRIVKRPILPRCPFCDQRMDHLVQVKAGGFYVTHRVFCCPHCERVVGASSAEGPRASKGEGRTPA
jgi:hypothetical protein